MICFDKGFLSGVREKLFCSQTQYTYEVDPKLLNFQKYCPWSRFSGSW